MTARQVGLLAWAALLLLQPAWHLWLAPPRPEMVWPVTLIAMAPLLLPLLAWRRGVLRMLVWVGIAALLYFVHGAMFAWAEPSVRGLALAEVALSVLLTGTLAAIVRGDRARRGTTTG